VKASVTETDFRPAMRSDDAILNETDVTASWVKANGSNANSVKSTISH